MDFLQLFNDYGSYIFLPVVVYFLVQGLKTKIPFFKTVLGLRILHFMPVVLGVLGGLLLPNESWKDQVLIGGGLGCLNLLIYKFVKVSLAPKKELQDKLDSKK